MANLLIINEGHSYHHPDENVNCGTILNDCVGRNVYNGADGTTINVQQSAPSMGETAQLHSSGRKQIHRDAVTDLVQCEGTQSSMDQQDCVFKREGLCVKHGVMGAKNKQTSKEWSKKENGIYGWLTRTKVKYVCRFDGGAKSNVSKDELKCQDRGVPASNRVSPELGLGERTRLARGGDPDLIGINLPEISGVDYNGTGSNRRESLEIMSERKDTG